MESIIVTVILILTPCYIVLMILLQTKSLISIDWNNVKLKMNHHLNLTIIITPKMAEKLHGNQQKGNKQLIRYVLPKVPFIRVLMVWLAVTTKT